MAKINLLEKSVAELIAAGEVIEKPSSVIKEVIENSIDAGAKAITVEIKDGGITYMRVTDDGCGIAFEEIPTAFLRHATSKVRTGDDLYSISTMGFRGEALASLAAVSRVELMTKRAEDEFGSLYKTEGGEQTAHEKIGCPDGTTIIVRDLFFNTPARLKFLKKDVSEGNYVQSVVDKLALANPQVSFRFIRDNKQIRITAGDGDYYSAIYSVFGKQFAASLIPVNYSQSGITVCGYVNSPLFARGNRTMQYFYVNSRYIRSTTIMAATEEAFRGSIMVGKFPAAILNIIIPPNIVDVNVHPAKTEVRFADDKLIFDAVYFSVKNAVLNAKNSREISLPNMNIRSDETQYTSADLTKEIPVDAPKSESTVIPPTVIEKRAPVSDFTDNPEETPRKLYANSQYNEYKADRTADVHISQKEEQAENDAEPEMVECFRHLGKNAFSKREETPDDAVYTSDGEQSVTENTELPLKVIGELFSTYIVCESGNDMILMDKHAAHERIRFEKLKKDLMQSSQLLTESVTVRLSAEQFNAVTDFCDELSDIGIEYVEQSDFTLEITAMPNMFAQDNAENVMIKIADILCENNEHTKDELFDDILHSMACKSAIKANDVTSFTELEFLANQVWNDKTIRFCPHGRPIITTLSKSQLEKYFSRT